jgi:hypothetical protein
MLEVELAAMTMLACILHLLYLHKEGTTQLVKHIKNVDGTWGAPTTLFSYDKNLSLYQGQLMIDNENNVHFFPVLGLSPRNIVEHWTYNGSSWSNERLPITSWPTDFCHDVVIDKRGNFHILVIGDSGIDRITNESGSWETKTVVTNYSSFSTLLNTSFKYDSGQDRLYCSIIDTTLNDVGFISFDLTAPTYTPSASSESSVSQSSSSSADSKSSESSSSSSDSSSSGSSSSDSSSSSSFSQDSKSSPSSSSVSSSSSSSSSADSKSSSSESSSSESSPSAFSCSAYGGNFATGQTYSASDESGGDAEYAFNVGGYWGIFGEVSYPAWVQIDLDYPKAASLIEIYSVNSALQATNIDVYASNTGNFTGEEHLILSETGITYPSPDYMASFETYIDQRYSSYRFVVPSGPPTHNMRIVLIRMYECYDVVSSSSSESSSSKSSSSSNASPSSESSDSSSSSLSISSLSLDSQSSESFDLVGLYQLCENFNVSSSSSSYSESSLSGQAIGFP